MERREFLELTAGMALITCGCSGCSAFTGVSSMDEIPQELILVTDGNIKISLDDVPELREKGCAMKLKVSRLGEETKIVLIHANDGQFYAVENKCAHMGRELDYKQGDEILRCTSFGHSQFELDGDRIKGPARNGIRTFPVSVTQNELVISIV